LSGVESRAGRTARRVLTHCPALLVRRFSMARRRSSKIFSLTGLAVASLAVLCATNAASAANWFINVDAPDAALEDFHRDFAAAVYPYPEHGGKHLRLGGL